MNISYELKSSSTSSMIFNSLLSTNSLNFKLIIELRLIQFFFANSLAIFTISASTLAVIVCVLICNTFTYKTHTLYSFFLINQAILVSFYSFSIFFYKRSSISNNRLRKII